MIKLARPRTPPPSRERSPIFFTFCDISGVKSLLLVHDVTSESKESVEISLPIVLKTVQPSPAIPVGSQDGVNDQPMRHQANGVTNRIPKSRRWPALLSSEGAITGLSMKCKHVFTDRKSVV